MARAIGRNVRSIRANHVGRAADGDEDQPARKAGILRSNGRFIVFFGFFRTHGYLFFSAPFFENSLVPSYIQ